MRPRRDTFAGVVQQQGEIEHEWVFEFLEQLSILNQLRIIGRGECVQLIDADQSMFVGGVAMKKLVLHETGELPKLRKITPEKIDTMHHAQNATDLAFARKNSFEYFAGFLRVLKSAG